MDAGRAAAFRTDRLPAWNRRVAELLGALSVRAASHDFRAALRHRACGALAVSAFDSSAAGVDGAASGEGCFVLFNQAGTSRVSQDGREAELGPGEVTLLRREAPYRVAFAHDNRMLVLALPADARAGLDRLPLVQRGNGSAAALVGGFMTHLLEADIAASPALAQRTAEDLLAWLWPRGADDASSRPWEARLVALVEQRWQDPELDARALGRALGISARSVQLVFARRGTTLSAQLLEQRLQWVAARLQAEPRAAIGTLAFDAGFSDLSHFCRSFQRRFGCSASQWRRRH